VGWLALLALLLCAPAARAHIVYGTKTLHGLIAEADLVLRARIVAVGEPLAAGAEARGASRPTVEAEVLEVLKGALDAPRVRFAQHGHGVAQFEPGRETLLFLIAIARSRELDALGQAGALAWVSLQEHEDLYPLDSAQRERLLAVVQAYGVADAASSAEARQAALRQATLGLLTSGDPRLAGSAVRDLVVAPGAPLVNAEDRTALQAVIDDPRSSMGVRVALLAELERRGIVEGLPIWLRLLSAQTPSRERVVAIRAAGGVVASPVRARLIVLLKDPDVQVAAAAAAALGTPGNRDAVAPLSEALSSQSEKLRMAAIRGLGRIATPEASRALESAAASHPDPATRRRARAEIGKRRAASIPR
jgi:hypothetical protein